VCGYAIEVVGGLRPLEGVATRLFNLLWNIGLLINFTGIVVLLYQLFASKTHGIFWIYLQNTLPFALWFNTFGLIAQLSFSRWRQFEDRYFAERWYIVLSLSTKFAVFWLGFGSFREILEQNNNAEPLGVNWRGVRYSAIFAPAVFVVAYALYDINAWAMAGGYAPRNARPRTQKQMGRVTI
jgi:hypothetical protein